LIATSAAALPALAQQPADDGAVLEEITVTKVGVRLFDAVLQAPPPPPAAHKGEEEGLALRRHSC
jgi:hypothetical protein